MVNFTIPNSKEAGDEQFFVELCNNITASVSITFQSVLEVLNFNNDLMSHEIPTSVQLQLSLMSSKLQRSFMSMRSQIEELIRLTKLYSTSWEEKNQCLKALHQQYNSKQCKLDIALKKFEMLSGRNDALEKLRVQMNWEKMFLKLNQNKTSMFGWRHAVSEYKQNIATGMSVAHLFKDLDESKEIVVSDKYKVDVDILNKDLEESVALNHRDEETVSMMSMDSHLGRFSSDGEQEELRFSSQQEDEKESSISHWISSGGTDTNYGDKFGLLSQERNQCVILAKEMRDICLQTECPTLVDKSSNTRDIKYSNTLVFLIEPPAKLLKKYSSNLHCTTAFNERVQKLSLIKDTNSDENENTVHSSNYFECSYDFNFEDDYILQCSEFQNAILKVAFHPDEKQQMIAFAASELSEMKIPCVKHGYVVLKGENEISMRATVDQDEFRFNQPCGIVHIHCYISQTPKSFHMDQATETLSLNDIVEDLMLVRRRAQLERCKSACVETEEKPVYTEHDLELVRGDLTLKLQQLKDDYEDEINSVLLQHGDYLDSKDFASMATSPILMMPMKEEAPLYKVNIKNNNNNNNNNNNKDIDRKSSSTNQQKMKRLKFSQQWGKDLPQNFLMRVDLFQEASQQYHNELKSKTKETVQKEIKKKLNAEKKLSHGHSKEQSVFSRDVCLPAVFMPVKNKQSHQLISGRSYLSPIKSLQLPFLINANKLQDLSLEL